MSQKKLDPRNVMLKPTRQDKWAFRFLLVLCFVFCLCGGLVARLFPRRQAGLVAGHEEGVSVFAEARSAAYAAAGYAFQC